MGGPVPGCGFVSQSRSVSATRIGFCVPRRNATLMSPNIYRSKRPTFNTCSLQSVDRSWEDHTAQTSSRKVRNSAQLTSANRIASTSSDGQVVQVADGDAEPANVEEENNPFASNKSKSKSCPVGPAEVFEIIREEALQDSKDEPALASFMYSTILSHKTLGAAMAFLLGNKLASPAFLDTQIMMLFLQVYDEHPEVTREMATDIVAVYDRDPACEKYSTSLLNFKGFQALQAYRVTHCLWTDNRKALAVAIQSRISEVFHVDIHPAAKLGRGLMLDHATGVVIGETAVVGDNVSMLHHVTLGGTGAEGCNRHPKIGDGCLIGAGSTILGNVRIGVGVKIGAGSVVLNSIPDYQTAVGVPARILKTKKQNIDPSFNMDHTSFMTDNWDDYMI